MTFHQSPTMYVRDVTLNVENLDRSLQFYKEVLGFEVARRTQKTASLITAGGDVLLILVQSSAMQKFQPRMTGLYHFALLLPSRKDLSVFVRHLLSLGLRFGSGDHLVSEAIYFSDPDGHGIEVYADRNPTSWNWRGEEVEMATLPIDFDSLLSLTTNNDSWEKMPKGTVMGHIHLQVKDMEQNERFYVEGLGYQIVSRLGKEALFLSDNNYHHHVAFNTWAGSYIKDKSDESVGIKAFTVIVPSIKARREIVSQLKKQGFIVEETEGKTFAYDPSNIIVTFEME